MYLFADIDGMKIETEITGPIRLSKRQSSSKSVASEGEKIMFQIKNNLINTLVN